MDVFINSVEMLQEVVFLCPLDDDEGIIHKSLPECGGVGAVARAFISRSSINRLATMGLTGDPIAAPLTCSNIFPWKVK